MRLVRHWPLWLLIALLPALAGSWCDPVEYNQDAAVDDGGTSDAAAGTSRLVTFDGQSIGEWGGAIIDSVVVTASAYSGSQTVMITNMFGAGQDVQLACGALTVQPPEAHGAFALYFNDNQGAVLVDILDETGTSFLTQPINSISDASTYGITAADGTYKKLTASATSSSRRIGALVVASCAGYVHKITLD